jgi:hypothetical protein
MSAKLVLRRLNFASFHSMRIAFLSQQPLDEMQVLSYALAQYKPASEFWLFTSYENHPLERSKPDNLHWIVLKKPSTWISGWIYHSIHQRLQPMLRIHQIDTLVCNELLCRQLKKIRVLMRITKMLTDRTLGVETDWKQVKRTIPVTPMVTPRFCISKTIPLYMGTKSLSHPILELYPQHHTVNAAYFMADAGSCDTLAMTQFLKGYTQFKKFQKSSMKLVLGIRSKDRSQWEGLLEHYMLRADVRLAETEADRRDAMFGAYAVCFLHHDKGIENDLLNLMLVKKPMVILENKVLREIFGQGVEEMMLTEQDVAKHLMQLYKDESAQQTKSDWMDQWTTYHQEARILETWMSLLYS